MIAPVFVALANAAIAFLCGLIASVEYASGSYGAALAYMGFGVGYIGLAFIYLGM